MLQHFRPNEECGVLEELEPIDSNLKYDFNLQVYSTCMVLPQSKELLLLYFDVITAIQHFTKKSPGSSCKYS